MSDFMWVPGRIVENGKMKPVETPVVEPRSSPEEPKDDPVPGTEKST